MLLQEKKEEYKYIDILLIFKSHSCGYTRLNVLIKLCESIYCLQIDRHFRRLRSKWVDIKIAQSPLGTNVSKKQQLSTSAHESQAYKGNLFFVGVKEQIISRPR